MAEPDYSAPVRVPPAPGAQGPISAPLLSAQATPFTLGWPQHLPYEPPYGPPSDPLLSQIPDISSLPFYAPPYAQSPYSTHTDHHSPVHYPPPSRMFPYTSHQPRLPPAFRTGSDSRTDHGDSNPTETLFRDEPPMPHGSQPWFPLHRGGFDGHSPLASLSASDSRRPQHTAPHNSQESLPGLSSPQDPVSLGGFWIPPRHFTSSYRRPSQPDQRQHHHRHQHQHQHQHRHQHQHQHHTRVGDRVDRPSSLSYTAHDRHSNRTPSPRTTSTRRNFESYSWDILSTSTSSDAEEAAARTPPSTRAQNRPRDARPRHFSQQPDATAVVARQIQDLKAKLPKYLASELAKDKSPTCDICSKDYSTKHVQPSEDEEMAVQLICGHSFGEFCISQWVSRSLSLDCSSVEF
jgi:hypothetical protein